jgi:transposase
MIDYKTFLEIKYLYRHRGLKCSQIAERLGLDERTVGKWLRQDNFRQRQSPVRSSKLDAFKDDIVRMLETHPYSAVQVYQRICDNGYSGRYTIVKDYVRKVRPRRQKAFLKLAFAPGQCAQVDWGSFGTVPVGETTRRLSFFVMVLCYSRMMYVEFTVSQTMEHFLGCHQKAFLHFGAVPEKIMVDNLKSAVLKRIAGQAPVLNPKYKDFADHYGFEIVPCSPGKGNEKGRVENAVGYVKKNFLSGLQINDFSAINPAAAHWLNTVANVRLHGETGKKPAELFEQERAHLKALPVHPYDIATILPLRAGSQFRICVDTNRYSVPAEYAGCSLTVKAYPDRLCIYHQGRMIARHVRSYDRRKDFELPDHPKALLAQRKKARDHKIFMSFLALHPRADDYYRQLEQRRMNPLHHIRQIVALSEIYGKDAAERAMHDAFYFNAFSCEYIANLLEQRARKVEQPGVLHLTRRQDLLELTVPAPDMNIYDRALMAHTEVSDENGHQ